jgi:capsular polysaccharide export protein
MFKPHPDVEHLGRAGALDRNHQESLADVIARRTALENLLPVVSHVETYSSLAGFEAILRGIPVTVHGLPFYAGWGLTEDLAASPRRGGKLDVDELVAVALLKYPRYWDPVSQLICPPEAALRRIGESRNQPKRLSHKAGIVLGRSVIMMRRLMRMAKGLKR